MRGRTLLIAGLLTAAYAGQAAAQIATSPHDLSAMNGTADNEEICVYCHTPHGAETADVPLWNKALTGTTFSNYSSSTLDETIQTVGSVSIACLTCHDGTLGIDAIINAPGAGNGSLAGGATLIGTVGGNANANLTADLSDDHPIGMVYSGFSGSDPLGFQDTTGGVLQQHATKDQWWVNTLPINTTRDKTDMILYTRNDGGSNEPYVECASCHDPHNGQVADRAVEVNFLRISNAGSDVCLACHIK